MLPFCESPEPIAIVNSDKYYLPGGDLYILVHNVMFRIHRYFLQRDSALFQERMAYIENDPFNPEPTGTTRSDAIMFFEHKHTTPRTFSLFLSIIYNPKYNIYYPEYTRQDWFSILYVATQWSCHEIERVAMQQINIIDGNDVRIPSPTDTEPLEDGEWAEMYVDEVQGTST